MEENEKPKIIIIGLGEMSMDQFMDAFYTLIISAPEEIISYDETIEHKISKLNHVIKFFEEREEFEKCAKIKEIQNLLNSQNNEN